MTFRIIDYYLELSGKRLGTYYWRACFFAIKPYEWCQDDLIECQNEGLMCQEKEEKRKKENVKKRKEGKTK